MRLTLLLLLLNDKFVDVLHSQFELWIIGVCQNDDGFAFAGQLQFLRWNQKGTVMTD